MSATPKVLLMTGNQLRHQWAASYLADHIHLGGIVSEVKAKVIRKKSTLPAEDIEVMEKHLEQRKVAEEKYFGAVDSFPNVPVLDVPHGRSNEPEVYEWIVDNNPDLIMLYGTSIIRPPLLDHYDGMMVNIHLGLSPYYRGTGTNFWPLVDGLPECVGATIHLAILKVDAGAMLQQVRPEPEPEDNAHDLGTKTIIRGFEAIPEILRLYFADRIEPQTQRTDIGKLFKRKDFNAKAVLELWQNLSDGMMKEFVSAREKRIKQYPILERPVLR